MHTHIRTFHHWCTKLPLCIWVCVCVFGFCMRAYMDVYTGPPSRGQWGAFTTRTIVVFGKWLREDAFCRTPIVLWLDFLHQKLQKHPSAPFCLVQQASICCAVDLAATYSIYEVALISPSWSFNDRSLISTFSCQWLIFLIHSESSVEWSLASNVWEMGC